MNSFIIIEYIKTSIDILVDIKVKDKIEAFFNNYHNKLEGSNLEAYEELLQKSESDIRNHIKIEHQMKIYSDNLKAKIEELEKSKGEYKKNYLALQEVLLL
jgi:succinate dehydrogenase flavin-adding protein (antitoxin of CptAB toxin-antitoxin module)